MDDGTNEGGGRRRRRRSIKGVVTTNTILDFA
jgi:hypothetical protein